MSNDDHRLDPELLPVIQAHRARYAGRPPMGTVPPEEMRVRASAEFVEWNANPLPLALVRDFTIPAGDGLSAVPVRLYDPFPDQPGACLVYFHGGGWIIGDLEIEDAALRRIAIAGGVKVLSVDYRLAPEHPFPAAIEDGAHVVRWLECNGAEIGVDASHLALGGGSAGANVALGTALRLRDAGQSPVRFLALLYGAFSGGKVMASHEEFGDGRFGLPLIAMQAFWHAYLGDDRSHPHAVPLKADLTGLPPALLIKAELDVLADESDALAAALAAAGGRVDCRNYAGAMHGFTQYAKVSALGRSALEDCGRMVAAALD